MSFTVLALVLAFAAEGVRGHAACNGFDRERERSMAFARRADLSKRQASPAEASQAAINGTAAECSTYNWPPGNAMLANYPDPWNVANIVPSDTRAQALFQSINASLNAALPNDMPKGTPASSIAGVNYPSSDPDCWWTYQGCTSPASSTGLKADLVSVPEPNTWGYTFDDGPLCDHNEFYDYLDTNNQKATMFYIGSNIQAYPLQAQRAIADGHHICVHTWSHHYTTALSNEQVFAELYYGRQIIKDYLGVTTKCWRPPYGDIDNRVRFIANALNLTSIVWDQDTSDWNLNANPTGAQTTVDARYASFVSMGASGQYSTYGPIVLSHEIADVTVNAAMKWYPKIRSAFAHVVPIATAYNWTHPYVETNYTYPDFATYIQGLTGSSVSNVVTSSASAAGAGSTSAASSGSGPARTSAESSTSTSTTGSIVSALGAAPSSDTKSTSGGAQAIGLAVGWPGVAAILAALAIF